MKMLMKRAGMDVEEISNVEEVIIRTSDREFIFDDASVSIMTTHGQKTYQVIGEPRVKEKGGVPAIPEEDIRIVMDQTGVSPEEAKKALQENDGNPAEAIISLMS